MPAAKNRIGPGSCFGMLTVECDSGAKKGEEMHIDFLDWFYNEYLSEEEKVQSI